MMFSLFIAHDNGLVFLQRTRACASVLIAITQNVFDINKKSEHTSYCEVVRIFHVWWRICE